MLDLRGEVIFEFRDPQGPTYLTLHTHGLEDAFNLVAFPDLSVAVRDLLPPTEEGDPFNADS